MYWNQYLCKGIQKQPFWKQQIRPGVGSKTGIHWHLPRLHINNNNSNENRLRQSIISAGKSKTLTLCRERLICLCNSENSVFERNLIISAFHFKFNPNTEPPFTESFSPLKYSLWGFFCINWRTRLSWHYKGRRPRWGCFSCRVLQQSAVRPHSGSDEPCQKADWKRKDKWTTIKLWLSGKRRGSLKYTFFLKITKLLLRPTFQIILCKTI